MAELYLDLLRDPDTREEFLPIARVSPESFRTDEDIARAVAVGSMIGNMAKTFEAESDKRFRQFCNERRKAQTLHKLEEDFEEDAKRHVRNALARLDATGSVGARIIAWHAGWSLERDFGLRAPKLVAMLVTHALGLRPKMTERQVRYLCGWEQKSPMKNRKRENWTTGSV
jgi:cytosine/adenosine deaminase-related metal-dependent hydrolase